MEKCLRLCAKRISAYWKATPPQQKPPTITSRSEEVLVPVTVKDQNGEMLTALRKEDFRILEGNTAAAKAADDYFALGGGFGAGDGERSKWRNGYVSAQRGFPHTGR